MQLTDEQVDYFARINFVRGAIAERVGLLGDNLRPLLSEQDLYDIELSLLTLETVGEGFTLWQGDTPKGCGRNATPQARRFYHESNSRVKRKI